MNNPNFTNQQATYIAATSGKIYIFDPQYRCNCYPSDTDAVIKWVKETCTGGWQVKQEYSGSRTVWLQSEADYMMFILTWK